MSEEGDEKRTKGDTSEEDEDYRPTFMDIDENARVRYVPKKKKKIGEIVKKDDYLPTFMQVEDETDELSSSLDQLDHTGPSVEENAHAIETDHRDYQTIVAEVPREEVPGKPRQKEVITVKVVIIGEPAVGKTTLRKKYLGEGFGDDMLMTLGVDMVQKRIELDNWTTLDTQIWDVAGQDSLEMVTRQFLSGTQGAILVFDLTRDYTFAKITSWLERLHAENLELQNNIPFILVGNKLDLNVFHKVNRQDVMDYLEYLNRHHLYSKTKIQYIETSAKTGAQVEHAFITLGKTIMENFRILDGGM
jgi:small GTP-binding protein